jgi:hypothetical protein
MLSRKKSLFGVFCFLCALVMIAMGCKENTAEQGAPNPSTEKVTISEIKSNYNTLDLQGAVLKALITESIDVTNYTYLNLTDTGGEIWAAIPKTPVEAGKEIEISNMIVMKDFHSKTLDRTFETILFAVPSGGITACGRPDAEMPREIMPQMPADMMPGGMPHGSVPETGMGTTMGTEKAGVIHEEIKVSKATGKDAYTIEEIYSQKKALEKSPVRVRAKVVKFLPGIMGKNWVHLQDGTGTEEAMNYDLAVTLPETVTVSVGDEVIVCGSLVLDKDLGLGHALDLVVEDASIEKPEGQMPD